MTSGDSTGGAPGTEADAPGSKRLADIIRRHVLEIFYASQEDVTRAAHALGITPASLRRHLRTYGAWPPPK